MLSSWGFLPLLALGAYLATSRLVFRVGFPLDDAWIHQTYARNLARHLEWSFIPGQVSGGSTAPLWSVLLSVGYFVGINPYIWTFFLGGVLLWSLGMLAQGSFQSFFPEIRAAFPWVGAVFLLEWHLVWAAGSGMETLVAALLACFVLFSLLKKTPNWLITGSAIGLSIWVRPDGITLLGPAMFAILFLEKKSRQVLRSLVNLLSPLTGLFLAYLAFNQITAGTWWPNTFYAKQTEYAVLQQIPIWERLFSEFQIPLVGVGAILLPGVIYFAWKSIQERKWGVIAGYLWFIGFVGLYAWRLPVTYQHGRYILPALPVFLFWGICGYVKIITGDTRGRLKWVLSRAWTGSIAAILVGFWIVGMWTYAQDVAIIETEMVEPSRWIAGNTPAGCLVAAHDIGALGYFGNRQILDLAGLISPEVIPFMRQEAELAAFLNRNQVCVLMTFPDWYPELVRLGVPAFRSMGKFAPSQGHPNMEVYRWSQ